MILLPNKWLPRPYQWPWWDATVNRGIRRSILFWHRRAGKDDVALHKTAYMAHPGENTPARCRVGNYWHCLPQYSQARRAIWEAVNPHTGKKRIDEAFPKEIRATTRQDTMSIEFKNGSTWRVVGSDKPDSLVGAPPIGIVFSEWALSNPSTWLYLEPILLENGGWADFISTPRGRNHARGLYDAAVNDDEWFAEIQTIEDTGFANDEAFLAELEKSRNRYAKMLGSKDMADALIEQEYWCSFEAAILGSYWGREVQAAEREGRIRTEGIEPDENTPVDTVWDLGVGDSTAIWFFQMIGAEVWVLDYYEATGYDVTHYAEVKRRKPYSYKVNGKDSIDYVPHDAKQRSWTATGYIREEDKDRPLREVGRARQRLEAMRECGLNPQLVPQHRIEDGINAARVTLARCWFDGPACEEGLECLRQYRQEWDDDRKAFQDRPYHDWTSHGADAFRYLAMAWRMKAPEKPKEKPRGLFEVGDDGVIRSTINVNEIIKRNAKLRKERGLR